MELLLREKIKKRKGGGNLVPGAKIFQPLAKLRVLGKGTQGKKPKGEEVRVLINFLVDHHWRADTWTPSVFRRTVQL